jgi:prepilin-type N-terminal cleavage/methylation domain-containing protein
MMSRTGNRSGFTLIEVMIATAVLTLGIVFIYQAFFVSLESFGYSLDYLHAAPWIEEKIWQVSNDIERFGFLARIDKAGNFRKKNRSFYWDLACDMVAEAPDTDLYKIELKLTWRAGAKTKSISRSAYATYKYEE